MELKNQGQTAASALIHTDIRLEREHWTMFRNKLLGIAAAATLGTAAMLGSTAAHAVKLCGATGPATRAALAADCDNSRTFARETALTGADNTTKSTYYNLPDDGINIYLPARVGGGGDDYTVDVMLTGMVFRTSPELTAPVGGSEAPNPVPDFVVATGGASGDSSVQFELSQGTIDATTAILFLNADYAVSAGGGSIAVTIRNPSLDPDPAKHTDMHPATEIVKVAAALAEASVKLSPTATVTEDYKKFLAVSPRTQLVGSLGTVTIGTSPHLLFSDGTAVDALADIMQIGQTAGTANSSVSFSGNFSFAAKLFLHGDSDCGGVAADGTTGTGTDTDTSGTEMDLLDRDTNNTPKNKSKSVEVFDTAPTDAGAAGLTANMPQHLCIMVDGKKEIPQSGPYTAMGSYMKIANAAFGPMPVEQMLGNIVRDGTTIHLPYLTKHAKFHQRIRMVNRGSTEVSYRIWPLGDGDIAGVDATGMLEANSVTVLSLADHDIVRIPANRYNTSATLVIEAQQGTVDVATVQVTRANGASDTVVYSP